MIQPENYFAARLIWQLHNGLLNNNFFNQRISYQIVEQFSLFEMPCILNSIQPDFIFILFICQKNDPHTTKRNLAKSKTNIINYINALYNKSNPIIFNEIDEIKPLNADNINSCFDKIAIDDLIPILLNLESRRNTQQSPFVFLAS